jgi:hypothetical protein
MDELLKQPNVLKCHDERQAARAMVDKMDTHFRSDIMVEPAKYSIRHLRGLIDKLKEYATFLKNKDKDLDSLLLANLTEYSSAFEKSEGYSLQIKILEYELLFLVDQKQRKEESAGDQGVLSGNSGQVEDNVKKLPVLQIELFGRTGAPQIDFHFPGIEELGSEKWVERPTLENISSSDYVPIIPIDKLSKLNSTDFKKADGPRAQAMSSRDTIAKGKSLACVACLQAQPMIIRPGMVRMGLMLQEAGFEKLDWQAIVSVESARRFWEWHKNIPQINLFVIPRFRSKNYSFPTKAAIRAFSDAPQSIFGLTTYSGDGEREKLHINIVTCALGQSSHIGSMDMLGPKTALSAFPKSMTRRGWPRIMSSEETQEMAKLPYITGLVRVPANMRIQGHFATSKGVWEAAFIDQLMEQIAHLSSVSAVAETVTRDSLSIDNYFIILSFRYYISLTFILV